ncbi:NADH-quinone oxidoreductase subunit L [Thermoflexales bacterium]|nr:NADH-quinone oxidoreductase subunit L [Thermoflexales bacterium]
MNASLILPLLMCFAGALVAAAYGWPVLNWRVSLVWASRVVALAPVVAFAFLLDIASAVMADKPVVFSIAWLPTLGLNASLYFDGLSALFALLITGMGVIVVIYAGYYFSDDRSAWRFLTYLMLFMTAMLGVVMAGDVITLFVFWEATSITSYLLIAYKTTDDAARRGALKALLITGGGGIALLLGLLLVSGIAGGADFATILNGGEALRQSALYPAMVLLLALGAFTKSAQTPFHVWLPQAMTAPTPASAYLHSATMVKAGIYLLARLNPALGTTTLWFWVLTIAGLTTMLVGAYQGLKQNDLKALLAYSTISQLGVLMLLIGEETDIASKALVIGILAHALYKSALFLIVGIIDHETGTRDLRRLGGLVRHFPILFVLTGIAALSMAGLPPLFGFLAKETLLATAIRMEVGPIVDVLFPAAAVIAGALLLAQAGTLVFNTFLGQPRDPSLHPHKPALGLRISPAIPVFLSLAIGLLPEPEPLAQLLASAASASFGDKVKVSLAIWTGINVPLLLSLVAISIGTVIFLNRSRVRAWMQNFATGWSLDRAYTRVMQLIDRAANLITRVQTGYIRHYLFIMLIGLGVMIVWFRAFPSIRAPVSNLSLGDGTTLLRVFALLVTVAAAALTIFIRRDFLAILGLSASGLGVALLMILEPAPDVALVQIVVDILSTLVIVLLLTRLPAALRLRSSNLPLRSRRSGAVRDALISLGAAVVVAAIVLTALTSRPRQSAVTPYYEQNAKPLTGATDIVGAIVVDFRGFDTLIEITVFGLAGLGVYTLLRYASRKAGDVERADPRRRDKLRTLGIGGARTSSFMQLLAHVTLPLSLIVAATHMMYGHDQPGDGFTAGVIVSLAVGLCYVVFGYEETKRRLPWVKSGYLIGAGVLLAIVNASLGALHGGAFLAPIDFGERWGLSLPQGFHLSTAFLFEMAICLSVLGSASYIIDTLGHPKDHDVESDQQLQEIAALEKQVVVMLDDRGVEVT